MAIRTGKLTPLDAPMRGETWEDPARGWGEVVRTVKGGTAVWLRFADSEVMYTFRAALGEWREFPGHAGNAGLRP